ncbi:YHS domain-containing (seleno)protein [Flavobacterium aurantiibacter]|uniref:YHS domain protein n=1 Tax=Flavobacterium aurantiibacter TaxID=2023067 RepID=A0A256A0Y6_9FLAO|nr:YHS domain-containing (seleno)protein [Flavobacterium aurantiibacter]OYQ47393.1 hypothetical protein CHX27_03200 [Flavobacterium aurantiibacter]
MRKLIFKLMLLYASFLQAQTNQKNGVAIEGHDPVAYFTMNKAVRGSKQLQAKFEDATYYFATIDNKRLFEENPRKYIPQYGGYCAYGMSNGYKAPIEPEAFTIVDGKLYLNYNLEVRKEWQKERDERIKRADANWNKMHKK